MAGDICKCGRPRYTHADLARWQNEIDKLPRDAQRPYNPEWARAVCWTIHDVACQMKPIKEQDMGDDLPRKLYEAWNSGSGHAYDLAWGLLEASKREEWERVAAVARTHMREQIAAQLEAEAREYDTHATDSSDPDLRAASALKAAASTIRGS